ncbi:MAG: hypothetical protein ACODAD_01665, partial [Planctomycetota bacterium]
LVGEADGQLQRGPVASFRLGLYTGKDAGRDNMVYTDPKGPFLVFLRFRIDGTWSREHNSLPSNRLAKCWGRNIDSIRPGPPPG